MLNKNSILLLLLKYTLIFFLLPFLIFLNAKSSEISVIKNLDLKKTIFFLRHADAPGFGDPLNFNINDCSTQRNLSEYGKKQSSYIGKFFKKNNIIFNKVYSSYWCRCKDTVKNMGLKNFQTHIGLNSFFQKHEDKNNILKNLNKLLKFLSTQEGPYLLVTHYVVISNLLKVYPKSGEIYSFNWEDNNVIKIDIDH